MLQDVQMAFIGGGTMAEAIIKCLLAQQLVKATQLKVGEPLTSRRLYLQSTYGVQAIESNLEAVQEASFIVMCVKPQVLPTVMQELHGKIPVDALVLSIVAGASIATLQHGFKHKRIVRTMPNTPAQVGMGATVWTATPEVTSAQRTLAETMLEALGTQLWVPNEKYIDMGTGLSGPGPAFVFLFVEALIDAGVALGFNRPDAQKLVLQTLRGSVELMRQSAEHPAILRNQVTSPGGATAAGLYTLEKGGLRAMISDAVHASYQRTQELGRFAKK